MSDEGESLFSRQLGLNVRAIESIAAGEYVSIDPLTTDDRVTASLTVDDIKRAAFVMRESYGARPTTMIVSPWMLEWPRRLVFTGYFDVLDRTRPWPHVVLFRRLARLELRAEAWRRRPRMQLEKLALRLRLYGVAKLLRG